MATQKNGQNENGKGMNGAGGTKQRNHRNGAARGKDLKLIVLYSSDPDFCMSFTLLFQDRYRIVTMSDLDMLSIAVEQYAPDLVIADAVPNERIGTRFNSIKHDHPGLPIILFYVSRLEPPALKESMRQYVDAMFSKPIDLNEVTLRIDELVRRN